MKRDITELDNHHNLVLDSSKKSRGTFGRAGVAGVRRRKLEPEDSRTNDEIHGTIRFCPVMKAVIDTPPFQRLRYLKQLGNSNNVYMCANHSRFEHSIGVARLAQRVCEGIKSRQPSLPCSSVDILCLKLAGLFHDLGHGPFSHVFEVFVKERFPLYFKTLDEETQALYQDFPLVPRNYGHEEMSLLLIDECLASLGLSIDLDNLDGPLKEIGDVGGVDATSMHSYENDGQILTSRDLVFVKECIWGKPIPHICGALGMKGFIGRPGWEKEWMYDIVANRHSGLDVDKIDYFARDAKRCYGDGRIDEVVVEEAVVAWGDCTTKEGSCEICRDRTRPHCGKHLMICFPDKMTKATINFFNRRFELHSTIYYHKTTRGLGHMVCDILCKADPYFRLKASPYAREKNLSEASFPSLPISRAITDSRAFIRLRDSVIEEIANSDDPNMEGASHLAGRFLIRDKYKCIFWQDIDENVKSDKYLWDLPDEEIEEQFVRFAENFDDYTIEAEDPEDDIPTFGDDCIVREDVLIDKFTMHRGQKDRNPIENIRVVSGAAMARKLKVPNLSDLPIAHRPDIAHYKAQTPITQQQRIIRVYCRSKAKNRRFSQAFHRWVEEIREFTSVSNSTMVISQTPLPIRREERLSIDLDQQTETSEFSVKLAPRL